MDIVFLMVQNTLSKIDHKIICSRDFNTSNCLLGAAKVIKNADLNKNEYSGYGIEFDAQSLFSLSNGKWKKKFFGK